MLSLLRIIFFIFNSNNYTFYFYAVYNMTFNSHILYFHCNGHIYYCHTFNYSFQLLHSILSLLIITPFIFINNGHTYHYHTFIIIFFTKHYFFGSVIFFKDLYYKHWLLIHIKQLYYIINDICILCLDFRVNRICFVEMIIEIT